MQGKVTLANEKTTEIFDFVILVKLFCVNRLHLPRRGRSWGGLEDGVAENGGIECLCLTIIS